MPKTGWTTKRTRAWPEGQRNCTLCLEIKNLEEFDIFKKGARGRYPVCKQCRVPLHRKAWKQLSYKNKMIQRAKRRNKEFSITVDDIPEIPEMCPVLKIPMDTPSLDRINSSKGYVPGNIRIISNRANTLKNNATAEEIYLLWQDAIGHVE